MPGGTYFLYVPAPKGLANGVKFENAEAASQYLITEQSILTVPWDDAGPFLRFAVTYEGADEAAEDKLMQVAEERLRQLKPLFV
jgi:LL-diaminopimelate aminotransferase